MADRIVPYAPAHGNALAEHMHPGNRREALALFGLDGIVPIARSVADSRESWTALRDDEPVAVFGIAEWGGFLGPTTGRPWLVCRDDIAGYSFRFLRMFRRIVGALQADYDVIEGYIDARNERTRAMCEWAGFRVVQTLRMGRNGEEFHRIVRKRGESACV